MIPCVILLILKSIKEKNASYSHIYTHTHYRLIAWILMFVHIYFYFLQTSYLNINIWWRFYDLWSECHMHIPYMSSLVCLMPTIIDTLLNPIILNWNFYASQIFSLFPLRNRYRLNLLTVSSTWGHFWFVESKKFINSIVHVHGWEPQNTKHHLRWQHSHPLTGDFM